MSGTAAKAHFTCVCAGHAANLAAKHYCLREYARGEVITNTVEGYYSIFERGMKGIYRH
jgi:hypothetical protein